MLHGDAGLSFQFLNFCNFFCIDRNYLQNVNLGWMLYLWLQGYGSTDIQKTTTNTNLTIYLSLSI